MKPDMKKGRKPKPPPFFTQVVTAVAALRSARRGRR